MPWNIDRRLLALEDRHDDKLTEDGVVYPEHATEKTSRDPEFERDLSIAISWDYGLSAASALSGYSKVQLLTSFDLVPRLAAAEDAELEAKV